MRPCLAAALFIMLGVLDGVLNKDSHDQVEQPKDHEEQAQHVNENDVHAMGVVEGWHEWCAIREAAALSEAPESSEHGARYVTKHCQAILVKMLRTAEAVLIMLHAGGFFREELPVGTAWVVDGVGLSKGALEQHAKTKQNERQEDHGPKKSAEAHNTTVNEQCELFEHFEFQHPHKLGEARKTNEPDKRDVSQHHEASQHCDHEIHHSDQYHAKVEDVPQHVLAEEVLGTSVYAHLEYELKEKDEREDPFEPVPHGVAYVMVGTDANDDGVEKDREASEGVEPPQQAIRLLACLRLLLSNVDLFPAHVGGQCNLADSILSEQDVANPAHRLDEFARMLCALKLGLCIATGHDQAVGLQHDLLGWRLRTVEIPVELGDGLCKESLLLVALVSQILALLKAFHLADLVRIDGDLVLGTENVECPGELVKILIVILCWCLERATQVVTHGVMTAACPCRSRERGRNSGWNFLAGRRRGLALPLRLCQSSDNHRRGVAGLALVVLHPCGEVAARLALAADHGARALLGHAGLLFQGLQLLHQRRLLLQQCRVLRAHELELPSQRCQQLVSSLGAMPHRSRPGAPLRLARRSAHAAQHAPSCWAHELS
mmetsp:Transcript_97691/g.226533  ORF Transcript_97691/g.226533 Transcript_97691/m.226533 type:complete len:604 (+) Transcript_97691:382-2193(+)